MEVDVEKSMTVGAAIVGAVVTTLGTAWRLVAGRVNTVREDLTKELARHETETKERFKDVDSELDADRAAAARSRERLFGRLEDLQRENREAHERLRADLKDDMRALLGALRHPSATP